MLATAVETLCGMSDTQWHMLTKHQNENWQKKYDNHADLVWHILPH